MGWNVGLATDIDVFKKLTLNSWNTWASSATEIDLFITLKYQNLETWGPWAHGRLKLQTARMLHLTTHLFSEV